MTFSEKLQKEKKKIQKRLRTDIPLERDIQTRFITALIALMSFMLVLSCTGIMALNNITNKWSSGLENKVTIEITAEDKNGKVISQDRLKKEVSKVYKSIKADASVKKAQILDDTEIRQLISPWISEDLTLDGIPMPELITLELKQADIKTLERLESIIHSSSKHAHLETYKEWLYDFLSLISSLKTTGVLIALLVFVITITSIAAATHTRMSLHRKDVSLLHLMGASDKYIVNQFVPHAFIITLKGSTIGVICALLTVILLSLTIKTKIIPSPDLSITWFLCLSLSPLIITAIALITSRITLLRTLIKMP